MESKNHFFQDGFYLFISFIVLVIIFGFFYFYKRNQLKGKRPIQAIEDEDEMPAWSPFADGSAHERFEKEVSNYFNSKGIVHDLVNGVVRMPFDKSGLDKLGLDNLAIQCKRKDVEEFHVYIKSHFDKLIKGNQFRKSFEKTKSEYVRVKKYLAIRIYDNRYLDAGEISKTESKKIGGNLFATLVYDLPDQISTVQTEDTRNWNISSEDLWQESLNNTLSMYQPKILDKEFEGLTFKFVHEDHFFVPTIISFNMHAYSELLGKYGSYVTIPSRHHAIVYPINDNNIIGPPMALVNLSKVLNSESEGALGSDLFWYYDGEIKHQPYELDGSTLVMGANEELLSLFG